MKFKFLVVLIFAGAFALAQQTFTFKYRLDYEFEGGGEYSKDADFFGKHFIPEKFTSQSKNSLVVFPMFSMTGTSGYTFIDGNTAISVQNQDLDNNFTISNGYEYLPSVKEMYQAVFLKKIDKDPSTILGRSCNYYQLFLQSGDMEEDANLVFCIDETSNIDNISFLLQQENNPIKGLILSVSPSDLETDERIVLTKINEINSTIKFDFQKELADYQVKKDSLEKFYNEENYYDEVAVDSTVSVEGDYSYYNEYMNQPEFCNYSELYSLEFDDENSYSTATTYISGLCSYGYSLKKGDEEKFKKFALKEIKATTKNFAKTGMMTKKDSKTLYNYLKKDIEKLQKSEPGNNNFFDGVEAVAAADVATMTIDGAEGYGYESYISNYEPAYKDLKPEDSSFAVTALQEESSYWNGIPAYCKKLETLAPDFSDEELKKHAKNYAGQICDMYLGEFDGNGVWYKGTLDAIRAEQLYFNNNKDKFSKKDKELLDEFLNSLD